MEEYGGKTRSEFERMSTEELEELVELDSSLEDGEGLSNNELLTICKILAEREREDGGYSDSDIQAAKERFYRDYYPNKSPVSVWDFGEDKDETPERRTVRSVRPRRFIRSAIAAAIAVTVLLALSITAYAGGFKAIATWTKETFNLSWSSSGEAGTPAEIPEILSELKEGMEEVGIPTELLPTYFPEGYECVMTDASVFKGIPSASAVYSDGEHSVIIAFEDTLDGFNNAHLQKDTQEPALYIYGSNEFYITTNMSKFSATWMNDTVLCDISGVPDYGVLLRIIESIGA